MAFSRQVEPTTPSAEASLAQRLVGMGVGLAVRGTPDPIIEDTLLAASIEGMEHDDLRVLAVLTSWLGVHHPWVNADRLVRAAGTVTHARTRAYWTSVGAWLEGDRRFGRLKRLHAGRRVSLLRAGTSFQIRRRGEDPRFQGGALRVPAGVLRDRRSDIEGPPALAKRHRTYRHRVRIGPTYRADMWALLESEPSLTTAELARRTYGSYATAWRVKRDFAVLTA